MCFAVFHACVGMSIQNQNADKFLLEECQFLLFVLLVFASNATFHHWMISFK